MKRLALLCFLLLLPAAQAVQLIQVQPEHPSDREVRIETFVLGHYSRSRDNPATGEIINVTFNHAPYHNYEVLNTSIRIDVTANTFVQENSIGIWNLTTRLDGVVVPYCFWHIETFNGQGLLSSFHTRSSTEKNCMRETSNGTHTVVLRRDSLSGTPGAVSHESFNIILIREDVILMPNEINIATAIDIYIPLLIWGGLVLLFLIRKAFMPAIIATVMLVNSSLEEPIVSLAWGILLVLIGIWLHIIAVNGLLPGGTKRET